ncbi:MAG: RadC family protein [Candidatus Kapaibacterium sp.]
MAQIADNSYTKGFKKFQSIREWRPDDRPREKLIEIGADRLSDSELLAILIGAGTIGTTAKDLANTLLEMYGGISGLSRCEVSQLRQLRGIGMAKSVSLAAAFELGKRIEPDPFKSRKMFRSPEDVASYFIPRLKGLKKEIFRALLLNSSNQLIKEAVVSEGILNASLVHAREVFRPAIIESAASVILMHNHPSGNPEPSREDISTTKKMVQAGKMIEIEVLDHIIIAGDSFTSLKQLDLM